jgi:hypothetical protein
MTTEFDPTTNRVPWGLLTNEEQEALQGWPHGIEYHKRKQWRETDHPVWVQDTVYRGKPAPVVTTKWMNVYPNGFFHLSVDGANKACESTRIALLRLDICNGVRTVHLEEL